MVGKLISALIAMVIGLALLPVVTDFANDLTYAPISVGAAQGDLYGTTTGALVDLLPVLYVIILIAGAVGYIVVSKKSS